MTQILQDESVRDVYADCQTPSQAAVSDVAEGIDVTFEGLPAMILGQE